MGSASLCDPLLGMPAAAVDFPYHRQHGAVVEIQLENGPHLVGFVAVEKQPPAPRIDIVAEHRVPPVHLPLRRAADILSRVRSAIISRSNCANDRRMLRVRRPSEFVVLNCCVTDTKLTLCFLKTSMIRAKSIRDLLSRSTL